MGASAATTVAGMGAGAGAAGSGTAGTGGRGATPCGDATAGVTVTGAGVVAARTPAPVASRPAPDTPAVTTPPGTTNAPAADTPSPPAGRTGRRAVRSAAANSSALWYRSAGSLLSARMTTPASASETPGESVRGLGGAEETCCIATATSVSPRNGTRPASIS